MTIDELMDAVTHSAGAEVANELGAEIDRLRAEVSQMRPVVEVALRWLHSMHEGDPGKTIVRAYLAAMEGKSDE